MKVLPQFNKDKTSKIDFESGRKKEFDLMTLECGRYEAIDFSLSIKIDDVPYNVLSFMIDCGLPNNLNINRSLTLVLLKGSDEGVSPVLYNYYYDINTFVIETASNTFSLLKL